MNENWQQKKIPSPEPNKQLRSNFVLKACWFYEIDKSSWIILYDQLKLR
jgi:hypothetical protein